MGLAETHLLPSEFVESSHEVATEGWQTVGASAARTDLGGRPAGVSFIVPEPKTFSFIEESGAWDLSSEGSTGRVVVG